MLMEAQASIRVDTNLRTLARTWAIVRPAGGGPHHKSVCAGVVPNPAHHEKAAGQSRRLPGAGVFSSSSWPGLSRPSTSSLIGCGQDVDARHPSPL